MNKKIEEAKKLIKGKEWDLHIARQCCDYGGFYCDNKNCKNYCCVLNPIWKKIKVKKK